MPSRTHAQGRLAPIGAPAKLESKSRNGTSRTHRKKKRAKEAGERSHHNSSEGGGNSEHMTELAAAHARVTNKETKVHQNAKDRAGHHAQTPPRSPHGSKHRRKKTPSKSTKKKGKRKQHRRQRSSDLDSSGQPVSTDRMRTPSPGHHRHQTSNSSQHSNTHVPVTERMRTPSPGQRSDERHVDAEPSNDGISAATKPLALEDALEFPGIDSHSPYTAPEDHDKKLDHPHLTSLKRNDSVSQIVTAHKTKLQAAARVVASAAHSKILNRYVSEEESLEQRFSQSFFNAHDVRVAAAQARADASASQDGESKKGETKTAQTAQPGEQPESKVATAQKRAKPQLTVDVRFRRHALLLLLPIGRVALHRSSAKLELSMLFAMSQTSDPAAEDEEDEIEAQIRKLYSHRISTNFADSPDVRVASNALLPC